MIKINQLSMSMSSVRIILAGNKDKSERKIFHEIKKNNMQIA